MTRFKMHNDNCIHQDRVPTKIKLRNKTPPLLLTMLGYTPPTLSYLTSVLPSFQSDPQKCSLSKNTETGFGQGYK